MMRRLWLSFAAVLVAVAGTQPAHSFDYKIHPGSLCQPASGADAVNFLRGPGFIYHTNALAPPPGLIVTCPIIRDRVPHAGRRDELTDLDIGMHLEFVPMITGRQTPSIDCRFFALDESGQELLLKGVLPTTVFANTTTNVISMFWEIKPDQTAVDGTYSINCPLPAYVFVLRYVVGEKGSTDDNGGF
jgi:hypothetical protein